MTDRFTLWAQALDNTSPDHFEVSGKVLLHDDSVRRQQAVSLVSSVIKRGAQICEKNGVTLTADDRHFVVEVPSEQRDSAGRIAPIVCYGDYDATVSNALGAEAAIALDNFARQIGRTLLPAHLKLVQASFETLKKKFWTTKLVRTAGIVTVGLVLLAAVFWLAQAGG